MKMAVFQWFRCFVGSPPIWGLFLASWPLGLLLASWPLGLLLTSSPLAGFLASCWPLAGLSLSSCWLLAGLLLASCWLLAGLLLTSCWLRPGLLLASCWPLAGLLLASCWLLGGYKLPHGISLENRFFPWLAKLVNSLHENGCFSMVSVFRGVSPNLGPLPGLLALAESHVRCLSEHVASAERSASCPMPSSS